MEIGNHPAVRKPERPESLDEFIATARMQFDMLAAIGVLTQGQASLILHLLQGDGGTLSAHDHAFRDNILHYLKKEADFVTVFAQMLQIDEAPAPHGPESQGNALARKRPRVSHQPPDRDPSVAPTTPKRDGAKTSKLSLPPVKTYILPAIVASGAVALAAYIVFTPGTTSVSPEPRTKSVTLKGDAGGVPSVPVAAVFPSVLSPAHAGEEPYEAYLNTCYDQYKANRETNANGGLSWNQNGGGYYGECLKRLHQ